MEERRLILVLAISIAFFALWTWIFPPRSPRSGAGEAHPPAVEGKEAPRAAGPAEGGSGEAGPPAGEGSRQQALSGFPDGSGAAPPPANLPEGAIAADTEETVKVETPLQTILFTNRGARITSWQLERYRDEGGGAHELISPAAAKLDQMPLQLLVQDADATEALKDALYRVERHDETDGGKAVTTVTFTWSDGKGTAATKTVRIPHDSYLASLRVAAEVGGRRVDPTIVWGAGFGAHTKGTSGGMGRLVRGAQGVVRIGDRIERRLEGKIEVDKPWIEAGPITWAGLEDKYFAALFIPESMASGQIRVSSMRLVEEGKEEFYISFALQQPGTSEFRMYVGPKDYDLLKGLGHGLDKLVDFGMFRIIARPLFYALKFIEGYTGNYGWAIVLLTIVIRLIFFPFMHRGQLKMRKMQDKMKRVNPKIKAMRERYRRLERKEMEKGRAGARHQLRQKMNQEMMELYKTEEINPLGSMSGCLPLLVQMPILYGFYSILSISIELRRAPFMLWIRDLSTKDPYYVTPIVMGVTMLMQQMMTSSSIPDPAQRRMMYIMPVMFTYFFINLPSGLVLYWLVNNLLGIAQQYFINKEADAAKAKAAG